MEAQSNNSCLYSGSFCFSEELKILEYYKGGKARWDKHDRDVIRDLKDSGYLRCGITEKLVETLKTTVDGLEYLKWLNKNIKRLG